MFDGTGVHGAVITALPEELKGGQVSVHVRRNPVPLHRQHRLFLHHATSFTPFSRNNQAMTPHDRHIFSIFGITIAPKMITVTGLCLRINKNRNIRNLMRVFFELIKAALENIPGFLHLQIFRLVRWFSRPLAKKDGNL